MRATEEVKQNLEIYKRENDSGVSDFQKMIDETRHAISGYELMANDLTAFNMNNLQKIHSIESNIKQIDNTLGSLSEISSQSRFIYINLSIEAVKLGEKSKGFQVIIKEIQNLNNKTNEFIRKINGIMDSFQDFIGKLWKDLELESQNIMKNMESSSRNSNNIMNSLIESYEITSKMFIKLSETNSSVQKSLDRIAETLQFQDISRQQIENIIDFFSVISKNIEENKFIFDFLNVQLTADENHLDMKIRNDFGHKVKVIDEKLVLDSEYKVKEGGVYDFHAG